MKENTLEVLFYLFDNYPEIDESTGEDRASMDTYLQGAGFLPNEIDRAFNWLESLGNTETTLLKPSCPDSCRIFAPLEQRWLNTECQNHLLLLEQAGILDAEAREQVIDRVLELEDDDFDLARLKWVVLMVLVNRPEGDHNIFWAEELNMHGTPPVYH
ncbi:MAG: hypothetical protein CR991_07500 [Proteobacteria bacterium]|nr:MAG: hypothetical protein CR991_07500 [Pseudomonadota bacterium]